MAKKIIVHKNKIISKGVARMSNKVCKKIAIWCGRTKWHIIEFLFRINYIIRTIPKIDKRWVLKRASIIFKIAKLFCIAVWLTEDTTNELLLFEFLSDLLDSLEIEFRQTTNDSAKPSSSTNLKD